MSRVSPMKKVSLVYLSLSLLTNLATKDFRSYLCPVVSEKLSVPQVADALKTTPPTVRRLLEDGMLRGSRSVKGTRTYWTVDAADLGVYLRDHGTFRKSPRASVLDTLRRELDALRQRVEDVEAQTGVRVGGNDRAEVVALREALRLQRNVSALQRDADDARSEVVGLLLKAMEANERADAKRRVANQALDGIVGQLTTPGDTSALSPT